MSAMEIDSAVDKGVEEQKGEGQAMPAAAAAGAGAAGAAAAPERSQKGKGEGDRNVMLHPVCYMLHATILFTPSPLAVAVLVGVNVRYLNLPPIAAC